MKIIKSTLALAAMVAVGAGVAQAQDATIPLTINVTCYVEPQTTTTTSPTIQSIGVNNSTILAKLAKALNDKTILGDKLAVDTSNGDIVIVSGSTIVYDLSDYETDYYNISTKPGPNGATIQTETYGYVYTEDDNGIYFYDPIWAGTENLDGDPSDTFKVTGHAVGGYVYLEIGYYTYVYNELTERYEAPNGTWGGEEAFYSTEQDLELSDGSAATVACKLAAGTYTESFSINCSGYCDNYVNWDTSSETDAWGPLTGTMSAAGTQTTGVSYLDPFNNDWYDSPYNDDLYEDDN